MTSSSSTTAALSPLLVALVPWLALMEPSAIKPTFPCKYSVRDVAFVNVHGKSWQLEMIKPTDQDETDFARWNKILNDKLKSSNLGFVWHEPDSQQAQRLLTSNLPTSRIKMFLTNRDGDVLPALTGDLADMSFEAQIDRLVHSPIREQLLNKLTDSLCVFLLIRGNDQKKNDDASKTADAAIEQIEKQMWMMEKASDNGPAIIEMNADDPVEALTMRSIGLDPLSAESFPIIAIMFGQARRLGDLILNDQIDKKTLVGLASICGRDCECELDREWLYGQQMIHDWTVAHERSVESSLDFDPKSAFVVAEVGQILQKSNRGVSGNDMINLGAGLVIHDLDQLEVSEETSGVDKIEEQDNTIDNTPTVAASTASLNPSSIDSTSALDDNSIDSRGIVPESSPTIPWFLFIGLAVVTIFVLLQMQKTRP